jgi:hypothetical protein
LSSSGTFDLTVNLPGSFGDRIAVGGATVRNGSTYYLVGNMDSGFNLTDSSFGTLGWNSSTNVYDGTFSLISTIQVAGMSGLTAIPVPEPTTYVLGGIASLLMTILARRRRIV